MANPNVSLERKNATGRGSTTTGRSTKSVESDNEFVLPFVEFRNYILSALKPRGFSFSGFLAFLSTPSIFTNLV